MRKLIEPAKRRLSPSSINTLFKCPRKWYYNYIVKLPTKINIHLLKGSAVHYVLENIFNFKVNEKSWSEIKVYAKQLLDARWAATKSLDMPEKELEMHYNDALDMTNAFVDRLDLQLKALINIGKAKGFFHGFQLLKPTFRELRLKDDQLNVAGFVDTIQEDFDGQVTIVDYKTSHKYKNTLSEDYKRQLAIYGLLYYRMNGKMPEYLCINYLRFGESFYIINTPSFMQYAKMEILRARNQIVNAGEDKSKFPKNETPLCNWCDFQDHCMKDE